MQERERTAENVTACNREKGLLRLDGVLTKQKGCRDEIGNTQNGLQNRNERINAAQL
jgi:hypothetical protein